MLHMLFKLNIFMCGIDWLTDVWMRYVLHMLFKLNLFMCGIDRLTELDVVLYSCDRRHSKVFW
jgi:hypothetical protein